MSKRIICLFFILFTLLSSIYSKDKQLTLWSPDKGISVNINIENGIQTVQEQPYCGIPGVQ